MTNVPTWISRMSAVALATTSISVFAAAPNAPDYIMHKASVTLKISSQSGSEIDQDTVKTKDVINLLMGRSIDAKNEKDEKLGLVTGCDADVDAVALVVYDKKTEEVKSGSGNVVVDIEKAVGENDKNGDLKKVDLIGFADADEGGFLDVTGQVRYGKIGSGCAKDGDKKDNWDKDSVCAKNFKSKSVTGLNYFGSEIVMSGKISAGSCQFAADSGVFPGVQFAIAKNADMINGVADDNPVVEGEGDTIGYDIKVTNLSNDETATGVEVDDIRAGVTVDCGGQTVLNPGSSMNCSAMYTVTQTDIDDACGVDGDGTIGNFATVTADGTDDFGASEYVDVDCYGEPGDGDVMAISKTANVAAAGIGDTITYTIDVTNLSANAQTNVTVTDLNPDVTLDNCGGDTDLDPTGGADDTIQCTGTLTVTEAIRDEACDRGGNIVNVAVVSSDETDPQSFAADEFVGVACPR